MKVPAISFLWLACLLLAGCQTIGAPKLETFNQRLAAGYVTVTGARQTALILLRAEKITADDGQQIQAQCDNARAGLDIARSLHASVPQAAETKLTAILTTLHALEAYLQSRGSNP